MGNKRDNAKKDHNWFRWRPPLCVVTGYHFYVYSVNLRFNHALITPIKVG